MGKKRLIILGSTGSVGRQTLEVIREANANSRSRRRPRLGVGASFEVVGLSANRNETLLKKQSKEFDVKKTVVANNHAQPLVDLVSKTKADLVVVAVSGAAGVEPTLAAIRSGKNIALATKETLVMAGELIMSEVKKHGVRLIPVDSEHNAIFQLLEFLDTNARDYGRREQIKKIILPCSGGPFWGKPRSELAKVTPSQALRHPVWSMGPKISIDSATLVNKGFEVIEAHHLFNLPYEKIDVVIHPECRIHGMVQLKNGRTLAYAAPPDMKIPIRHALGIAGSPGVILSLSKDEYTDSEIPNTFHPPDHSTFPGIRFGYEAGRKGNEASRRFVLANDRAVARFLAGEIAFLDIYNYIEKILKQAEPRLAAVGP